MGRRLLRVLGVVAVLASATVGVVVTQGNKGPAPARTWRRAAKKARPLLSILSPPGAGYDSTSVALGTASGVAVTIARASTQTCEISAGVLTSVASNKPCVESGSLKVEPSGTNLLLQSTFPGSGAAPTGWAQDFSTGTSATTTSTLGADAAAYAQTATAQRPEFSQVVSLSANTTYTASLYVEAVTGTITIGDVVAAVSLPAGASTAYPDGAATTLTPGRVRLTIVVGATAGTATLRVGLGVVGPVTGTLRFSRPQLETGSVATSYIPTAGATASRAAQTTTVAKPAGLSTTEGSAKVCVTPSWTGSAPAEARYLQGNTGITALLGYTPGGTQVFRAYDGTNNPNVSVAWVAGQRLCFRTSWSASRNAFKVENLSTGASGSTAFTALGALAASVYIGADNAGSAGANAKLDSICLSASTDGCR